MIRHHILAGSWYPASDKEMRKVLDDYVAPAGEPEEARGVLVPHAGWVYSGKVAGQTFAAVRVPDRVVVLAPNHKGVGSKRAVWARGAWTIPGASLAVDEALAGAVARRAGLEADTIAHLHEHSLEILLPFIHRRNPAARIVPVCLMRLDAAQLKEIGEGIAAAIEETGEDALVVASSDMSHYVSADDAQLLDGMALKKIEKVDAEGLLKVVERNEISMCGVVPAAVMLFAAVTRGAKRGRLVKYATSGEVSNDYTSVVGYAGMVVS